MKKLTLSLLSVFFSSLLFSQVYKQVTVFSDRSGENFLSYWKPLEGDTSRAGGPVFSLWGYQRYSDSWMSSAYEVEYFKGNAAAMRQFLQAVDAFSEKYEDEDKVVTFIAGVQVKTLNQKWLKYTLVFDRDNKVVCRFTRKQWKHILEAFDTFCKTNQISHESRQPL